MLQPLNYRTWAPSGNTPVQYAWDRNDRLSVIAAPLFRPRSGRLSLHFSLLDHNVKTPNFKDFLLELRRLTRRSIILVCDRLKVHRSAVQQFQEQGADWLSVEWLPPYAPDLNPVEAVLHHAKYSDLANRVPDDAYQLYDLVGESLNDQHYQPPLLNPSSAALSKSWLAAQESIGGTKASFQQSL
jgi:transposase